MMGRPTVYTDEVASEILERLAAGETLRAICRDAHVPPAPTVRGWVLDDREGFAERYARARGLGLDQRADELEEIPDTYDDVQRGRLKSDNRKWLLSRLRPDVYGDRITQVQEHPEPFEVIVRSDDAG